MTDQQYGNYQTPSSLPPEPPIRTNAADNEQAPLETAPLNASDTAGFGTEAKPYGSAGAPDAFRSGDTGVMPKSEEPYRQTARQQAQPDRQEAQARYSSQYAGQPRPQHQSPQKPAKKSGAGKTFLFGFLGALLACALCIGGYTAWTSANATGKAVSTAIGTTDSSVINAVDEGKTVAEAVAAKALPSVVAVYNYQQVSNGGYGIYGAPQRGGDSSSLQAAGMGSGVVISADGYIITNYHVVDGATKLTVKVGDEERDATYVGGDSSSDIAVVKVDNTEGLVAADIGDSDSLVIGEWVMTIGAPLGLEQSVATGVVSATNRSTIMDNSSSDGYSYYYSNSTPEYTYYPNMIQTDAVINPGNSGGALVDADGKLIGINAMLSSSSGNYAGVGFAIPINYAIGLAQDIIAGKQPTHAMLGVTISQVNSQIAQRYNLSSSTGAYISSITAGSGAANSDLQVGDIITAINGKQVTSTTDVTLDVRGYNVGETVTVTVNRNGETVDVPVTLTSDESVSNNTDNSQNQQNQQNMQNQSPYGNGNGNGYNSRDLEELLRMLGM